MQVDYFVYYRIAAQRNHAEARRCIEGLIEQIQTLTGVRGRLMMRRDDGHTWMEHYPNVSDSQAFEHALEDAAQRAGVSAWLEPSTVRHLERFIPCV